MIRSNNEYYNLNRLNFDNIIPGDIICKSENGKEHLEVIIDINKSNRTITTISSNTNYLEE